MSDTFIPLFKELLQLQPDQETTATLNFNSFWEGMETDLKKKIDETILQINNTEQTKEIEEQAGIPYYAFSIIRNFLNDKTIDTPVNELFVYNTIAVFAAQHNKKFDKIA